MRWRWIDTPDGSQTLVDDETGLTFRSRHGARTESQHVFVDGAQWPRAPGARWTVLEVGLGPGTNLVCTHRAAVACGAVLDYVAVERAPLPEAVFATGPAGALWPWVARALAVPGHAAEAAGHRLTVHVDDVAGLDLGAERFDAVYFDPFGPRDQPASWTAPVLAQVAAALRPQGRLLTYAASRAVKDGLRAAGLTVRSRPGAGGKRECTVGQKPARAV